MRTHRKELEKNVFDDLGIRAGCLSTEQIHQITQMPRRRTVARLFRFGEALDSSAGDGIRRLIMLSLSASSGAGVTGVQVCLVPELKLLLSRLQEG